MANHSIKQTAPALVITPAQAQLDKLVEQAIAHLNEGLTDLPGRLSAEFLNVDDPALDAASVYHRVRSGNLLKSQSYAYMHLASSAIAGLLRKEALGLRPQPAVPAPASLEALSLVPMEDMDRSVTFATISRPFEAGCAELLATLNVRLGFLLERDTLRISQNPFRPDLVLLALYQAWCEFSPDAESHPLFPAMLKPAVLPDFATLYDALNQSLEATGGQALRIRKTDNAARAKAERATGKAALARQLRDLLAGGADEVPMVPDLPAMPSGSGGWRPSGASAFAPVDSAAATAPLVAATHDGRQASAATAATAVHGASASTFHAFAGTGHGMAGAPAMHVGGVTPHPHFSDAATNAALAAGALHGASGSIAQGQAQAHGHHGGVSAVPYGGFSQAVGVPAGLNDPHGPHDPHDPHDLHLPFLPAGTGAGAGAAALAGTVATALAAKSPGQPPHGGAGTGAAHQVSLLDLLARLPAMPSMPAMPSNAAVGGATQSAVTAGNVGTAGMPSAPMDPSQVFYLPRLKQSMPAGALSRGDATTLDLLSRIFDTVYLDNSIPQPTRELIQYLQAPVLKAALLDQEFFYQEAHPARRMIDLMSRMGWEQRAPDDPLFQAMQRGVDRVGREPEANATVFAEAVAELETTLAAEDKAADKVMAAPIAAALKQEKVSAATKSARNAVALRISGNGNGGGGELATVVEAFLQQKWTAVLTIAYSVETDKPGAVGSATRTMDDLIWSVKPKITQEQRKQLIARLPSLLTTLNKWLDIIKWQDAERLQFFADLAECHASIVRAPIDLSPERQLEVAMEAAQQDALRRVEKEQALLAEEQQAALQAEQDPVLAAIDGLERGMWLELVDAEGSSRTVKLAWISPLRTLFIFSTSARKEAFSLQADKLATAWRDGRVRIIRQDGVVAQALAEALAGNDAAITAAA